MASNICVVPNCGQPRMLNKKGIPFTKCEHHQHEYWNNRDAIRRKDKPRGRIGRPPKQKSENISPTVHHVPALVFDMTTLDPKQPIKIVIIDRKQNAAHLIELPVLSKIRWSDVRRPEALTNLLTGSGYLVVDVEKSKL